MTARIFTRVATVHPATVTTHAGEIRTGQLRDVALGGFFITGLFLPLASRVTWEIELSAYAHIRGEGVVTRNSRDGIAIALDALGETYMALAASNGIDPALMHRVAVIGAGALDSLPHNGAVVTLLAVCGATHKQSYFDIVMVGIVGALLGLVAVIALGSAFGSF